MFFSDSFGFFANEVIKQFCTAIFYWVKGK
jgi:hypothetical protein